MTLFALLGSIETGIIFAIMALGVYLTFRILDFPDLTVDGSFVTGGAVAAVMIFFGYPPILASFSALIIGFFVGCITGILHTRGKINPLLSGILMMTALYSINLRIMGLTFEDRPTRPNIPLLDNDTIFTPIDQWSQALGIESYATIIYLGMIALIFKFITDIFLKTEIGLAIRATGDNKRMIRSFSANTDSLTILGLGISNAYVAFAGSLFAQYNKFADVNMGIGMIVVGLASVIIGEALFGKKTIARATFAVLCGAIIYRIIIGFALANKWLDSSDQRLITALIVIFALVLPKWIENYRNQKRKKKRTNAATIEKGKGGSLHAEVGKHQQNL